MSAIPEQLAGEFEPPESVRPTVERLREFIRDDVAAIEKEYEEHFGDPVNHLDENAKLIPEIHEAKSKVRRRSAEEGLSSNSERIPPFPRRTSVPTPSRNRGLSRAGVNRVSSGEKAPRYCWS